MDGLRPHCERIEIAGSLRRERELIGDIEIVALPRRQTDLFGQPVGTAPTALDAFLADRVRLDKDGPRQKGFVYGGMAVDLFFPASPDHWGCIYTIRTGSHDFNLWLVGEAAIKAGVKFDDGRLCHRWGQRDYIDTPEEADVFAALELPFVPPAYRDWGQWHEYIRGQKSLAALGGNEQ
jgi:DNA polymerase (family 10)